MILQSSWVLKLPLYCFMAVAFGVTVIGPGVYAAKEAYSYVDYRASRIEKIATALWSAVCGAILSSVLAYFVYQIVLGNFAEVKMWFVSACACAIFLPWFIVGLVGRRIIRRFRPLKTNFP